jgi:hypothetical protein
VSEAIQRAASARHIQSLLLRNAPPEDLARALATFLPPAQLRYLAVSLLDADIERIRS